jgi:multidrug transporter EmrE-like cation transporter
VTRASALLLAAASLAAAGGQLLLKAGAQHRTQLAAFFNAPILIGLPLYRLGTVLWSYVLSKEKLVVVYAVTVLRFALVYLASILMMGETLTLRVSCGVPLVLGGLYLLTGGGTRRA